MTLDELTNYVCTKAQLVETEDSAACALFLSNRYELIFDAFMWKDALTMVNVNFDPVNNLDNQNGVVMLPTQINRLVAVRTNCNSVQIQGLEHYYRIDWNAFNLTPQCQFSPSEMSILNPVWFTIRPISTWTPLTVPAGQTYDQLFSLTDPTILTHSFFSMTNQPNKFVKLVTGANDYGFNPRANKSGGQTDYTIQAGATIDVYGLVSQPFTGSMSYATLGQYQSLPGTSLIITSDNGLDIAGGQPVGSNPVTIKVTWRDSTDRYTTTSTLPLTLTPFDGLGVIEVESVFKPVTAGNITFTTSTPYSLFQVSQPAYTQLVTSLAPTALQSPSYQRIRVFPIPAAALTLNVLGKKPFIPLTFPTEVPAIRNVDNTLIAFAMGDMFVRARFPASEAAPFFQEGGILLKELALLESLQAAHNSVIEPSDGFGQGVGTRFRYGGYWVQ